MRRLVLSLLLALGVDRALAQAPKPAPSPAVASASKTNLVEAESRELKPGDEFSFRIEEDPISLRAQDGMKVAATELGDAYFRVSRGSDISVSVNVRGKRLTDVRRELKERLEQDYYERATITLDLVGIGGSAGSIASGSGKAIFFGEMKGMVPLPEGEKMTLSEAILRMGGGGGFANLKKVKVTRKDGESGRSRTLVINVDAVIHDNDSSKDLELQDGDRIEVPPKIFNF